MNKKKLGAGVVLIAVGLGLGYVSSEYGRSVAFHDEQVATARAEVASGCGAELGALSDEQLSTIGGALVSSSSSADCARAARTGGDDMAGICGPEFAALPAPVRYGAASATERYACIAAFSAGTNALSGGSSRRDYDAMLRIANGVGALVSLLAGIALAVLGRRAAAPAN